MPKITSKWFKEAEFTRLTPSCSLQDMDQTTMNMADAMREICGFPLGQTSVLLVIRLRINTSSAVSVPSIWSPMVPTPLPSSS